MPLQKAWHVNYHKALQFNPDHIWDVFVVDMFHCLSYWNYLPVFVNRFKFITRYPCFLAPHRITVLLHSKNRIFTFFPNGFYSIPKDSKKYFLYVSTFPTFTFLHSISFSFFLPIVIFYDSRFIFKIQENHYFLWW